LAVGLDHEHALAVLHRRHGEPDRERAFAAAAFLCDQCNYAHKIAVYGKTYTVYRIR
jgi:hypothetical protein